jgi:hypothetical protein
MANLLAGEGKTTYTFSVSVNVLSTNIPFCVVLAGGEGGSGGNGTNSLALAENVYVILPRPTCWLHPKNIRLGSKVLGLVETNLHNICISCTEVRLRSTIGCKIRTSIVEITDVREVVFLSPKVKAPGNALAYFF